MRTQAQRVRVARTWAACTLLVACTLLAALPALSAHAQDTPTATPAAGATAIPVPAPPQPLSGRALYTENCAPCHGKTGQGDGPSASGLGVPAAKLGDAQLASAKSLAEWFEITKNGNMPRMMPPWRNRLTDQQIWDTVAYAWTLHTSAEQAAQGQQVYDAHCATCHGLAGEAAQAGVPDLTDFTAASGVPQTAWAQVVADGKGEMPGFAEKLSAEEQAAVLVHTRGLSFGGPLFRGPLEKGTGVISGTVTNGTTNAPMPNQVVELGIFDNESLLGQQSATSDANGVYRFAELSTDPAVAFVVRTEHPENVPYSSEFVSFEMGQTEIDLPLNVYETTTDASGVRTERVHYIVEFADEQAIVAELHLFSLDGNRAFIGDGTGVLRFTTPAGAQGLTIDGDSGTGRFEPTADGFVDQLVLQPGQNVRQVLYRYAVPYSGGQLDLNHMLHYPAANVNALISDVGQQVSSPQLATLEMRATQNGNYHNLLGQDLPANQQVLIRMANLPAAGAVTSGAGSSGAVNGATTATGGGANPLLLAVLIGLAAGAALGLILLPILRSRGAGRVTGAVDPTSTRDLLVETLARLELAYEAGEIPESAYREQRLKLKAQVRDLLRREGQP